MKALIMFIGWCILFVMVRPAASLAKVFQNSLVTGDALARRGLRNSITGSRDFEDVIQDVYFFRKPKRVNPVDLLDLLQKSKNLCKC